MKPRLFELLTNAGLPSWMTPSYAMMVGLGSLLGAFIVFRACAREGVGVSLDARALAAAYVGALAGGFVYEWARVLPQALMASSLEPFVHVGRAAYGGLIGSVVAAFLYIRWKGGDVASFFDRAALAIGAVFLFVRTGCFLEGCDYGMTTSSAFGVRYPAGSLAAADHAAHGWIPVGVESLPTHPTQLYEGALAALGSVTAWYVWRLRLRSSKAMGSPLAIPAGAAWLAWLTFYAVGRAGVELVRGDVERGSYLGASSAQWTSALVLAGVLVVVVRHALRRHGSPRGVGLVTLLLLPLILGAPLERASAQAPVAGVADGAPPAPAAETQPAQPATVPTSPPAAAAGPASSPQTPPPSQPAAPPAAQAAPSPATTPATTPTQAAESAKYITLRTGLAVSVPMTSQMLVGFGFDVDVAYRIPLYDQFRLEAGLDINLQAQRDSWEGGLAASGALAIQTQVVEFTFEVAPGIQWVRFGSPFFSDGIAFRLRGAAGVQFRLGKVVLFGVSPAAFTMLVLDHKVMGAYRPRIWVGFAL